MKKLSKDDMDELDKIIIQSDELKKKVRIRVPKQGLSKAEKRMAKKLERDGLIGDPVVNEPNVYAKKSDDKKPAAKNSKLSKYRNLGSLSTDSKKGPSEFRKKSAKWRDGDNAVYAAEVQKEVYGENKTYSSYDEYAEDVSWINRLKKFTPIQWVAVGMAVVILATSVMTTGVYADYRGEVNKEMAFAQLPTFEDTADTQLAEMTTEVVEEVEPIAAEEPEEVSGSVLSLVMTSVEKDLKIKLVDEEDTLVKGVLWGVTVTDSKSNQSSYDDEDKDGIIHLTDISAGDYSVTVNATDSLSGYTIPSAGQQVSVKAKVEYKVIANIKDEIKSEKEVNAAAEDANGNQAADVESASKLTDTVEWVESSKTENGEQYVKSAVDLSKCTKAQTPFIQYVKDALKKIALGADTNRTNAFAAIRLMADEEHTHEFGEYTYSPNGSGEHTAARYCTIDGCSAIESSTESCEYSNGKCTKCGATDPNYSEPTPSVDPTPTADPAPTQVPTQTPTQTPGGGNIAVSSISIDKGSATIDAGKSVKLSATISPSDATNKKYSWSSNNNAIATVDQNGNVTGIKAGTATISVTSDDGGHTSSCTVTVKGSQTGANVAVTGVSIEKSVSVSVGSSVTLKPTITPSNASNQSVSWSTSDSSIASVDGGTVKGVKAGTATITVKTTDGGKTASCTVTVTAAANAKYKADSQLYDSAGNKLYKLSSDGSYKLAVYSDYESNPNRDFFRKESGYLYTGWQTINDKTYYYKKDNTYVTGDQVIGGVLYHFGSDGTLTKGSGTLGIDVSKYQPSINWSSVAASGISYVIIRCGYRGASTGALIQDPYFTSHIKGAKAAGLKVGVYFFSTALTEAEAVEEASMCAALCSGYGISYPVFIDVESSSRPGYNGLSAAQRTANIKAFCSTIKSAGYTPGVYANKTWFTSYINTSALSGYKIWLAQYNAAGPTYSGRYDLWQYTSKGSVNGIPGNVDMNQSYLGY